MDRVESQYVSKPPPLLPQHYRRSPTIEEVIELYGGVIPEMPRARPVFELVKPPQPGVPAAGSDNLPQLKTLPAAWLQRHPVDEQPDTRQERSDSLPDRVEQAAQTVQLSVADQAAKRLQKIPVLGKLFH